MEGPEIMAGQGSGGRVIPLRREGIALNGVFGTALFVFVEVMLFAGFISAFLIVESSALPGSWPPPDQPRLPVARTALNTVALLVSGVALYRAHRAYHRRGPRAAQPALAAAVALGGVFVGFQGAEWLALIRQGLTITSSQLGAFFYLIVGAHAAHAVAALIVLVACWRALRQGRLRPSLFGGAQLFWYFVVLMWPAIYWLVYL
jgi:cytochrome c oxidase subunit 3